MAGAAPSSGRNVPVPGGPPRAAVVVADPPCAGFGERVEQPGAVSCRHEDDELVERLAGAFPKRLDRTGVLQPERGGEGVADPGTGDVGIRVGREERAAGAHQRRDDPASRRRLGDAVHPAQEQRVVGHEQLGSGGDRLVGHLLGRIDREMHATHLVARGPRGQPHGIPLLGPRGVVGGDRAPPGNRRPCSVRCLPRAHSGPGRRRRTASLRFMDLRIFTEPQFGATYDAAATPGPGQRRRRIRRLLPQRSPAQLHGPRRAGADRHLDHAGRPRP